MIWPNCFTMLRFTPINPESIRLRLVNLVNILSYYTVVRGSTVGRIIGHLPWSDNVTSINIDCYSVHYTSSVIISQLPWTGGHLMRVRSPNPGKMASMIYKWITDAPIPCRVTVTIHNCNCDRYEKYSPSHASTVMYGNDSVIMDINGKLLSLDPEIMKQYNENGIMTVTNDPLVMSNIKSYIDNHNSLKIVTVDSMRNETVKIIQQNRILHIAKLWRYFKDNHMTSIRGGPTGNVLIRVGTENNSQTLTIGNRWHYECNHGIFFVMSNIMNNDGYLSQIGVKSTIIGNYIHAGRHVYMFGLESELLRLHEWQTIEWNDGMQTEEYSPMREYTRYPVIMNVALGRYLPVNRRNQRNQE